MLLFSGGSPASVLAGDLAGRPDLDWYGLHADRVNQSGITPCEEAADGADPTVEMISIDS